MKNLSLNFASLDDLNAWYLETVGYSLTDDDPTITKEQAVTLIREYLVERFTDEGKAVPVVTLKSVKLNSALSDETACFSATVYVDGKAFCLATNRGHGGDDEQHAIKPRGGWKDGKQAGEANRAVHVALQELNLRAQAFSEPRESDFSDHVFFDDFDSLVGAALDHWQNVQGVKRALSRKVHYRAPGKSGLWTYGRKYSPELADQIRAKYPGCVIVNEVMKADEAEALAWYFDDLPDPRPLVAA